MRFIKVLFLIVSLSTFFTFESCKDGNNPLENRIEIISLNPTEGYVNDTITITGKNFSDCSQLRIYFDSILVRIIFFENDSIKVEVPNITFGPTKITIKDSNNKILFTGNFTVLKDIFSSLSKYSISITNLPCIYHQYSYFSWYPNPPNVSESWDTLYNFNLSFHNPYALTFKKISDDEFSLFNDACMIHLNFKIDFYGKNFDSLNLQSYIITEYTDYTKKWYVFNLKLENFPYNSISDTLIKIDLSGGNLNSIVRLLTYDSEGTLMQGHQTGNYQYNIVKLYPFTDSSSIQIIISK